MWAGNDDPLAHSHVHRILQRRFDKDRPRYIHDRKHDHKQRKERECELQEFRPAPPSLPWTSPIFRVSHELFSIGGYPPALSSRRRTPYRRTTPYAHMMKTSGRVTKLTIPLGGPWRYPREAVRYQPIVLTGNPNLPGINPWEGQELPQAHIIVRNGRYQPPFEGETQVFHSHRRPFRAWPIENRRGSTRPRVSIQKLTVGVLLNEHLYGAAPPGQN